MANGRKVPAWFHGIAAKVRDHVDWWVLLASHMKDAAPKSQQVQTTIATAYREFGSALATPAHVCKDTVMLLQLTTKSKHRAKAIAALNAWVIDRTDGPAAVARAQQACVGFIKSTGTKIIRKRTLPAAFTNPTPTELTTHSPEAMQHAGETIA